MNPEFNFKMKRRWAIGLAAALPTALVPTAASAADSEAPQRHHSRRKQYVKRHLKRMSLEEKVGQVFVSYAYGETADTTDPDDIARNQADFGVDNAAQLLQTYHLGGIIYFAWSDNVSDPHQIAGLSNGLQQIAADAVGTPLLIATDQEHGLVTRIGPPAAQFPGAMALGATFDTGDARTAAEISGTELLAMGVNQNFAPVADVNVNPANPVIGVRSFSSDPEHAADMVAAQVEGYEPGVAAAVKHFPGHGDTDKDSHIDLPRINHTYEEWKRLDAPPFAAAVDLDVAMVMTAHVTFPALDESGRPATLSQPIITGLLREELGYDGVVITDALRMDAVNQEYGPDRVPIEAFLAGADILLMPIDMDLAYNAMLDAIDSGEISCKRLDQSVTRILDLKYRMGLFEDPYVDPDEVDDIVGVPEHLATAQEISDHTTTLVTNDGILPVGGTGDVLVTGWGVSTTSTVVGAFTDRGWGTERVVTGASPTQADIDAAVAAAEDKDLVVVTTNGIATAPTQADLVAALAGTGVPIVAVAVRNPYDIAYILDDANAYLATYSYGAGGLESAVKAIVGEIGPQGRLPVDVPSADDPDTVLFEFGHGLSY